MRAVIFVLCIVAALALLPATPADAQIDCNNIPVSAGPAPPELKAACGIQRNPSLPRLDPTDMALSPDGILVQCSSMTLNNPGATAQFGSIDFQPACDFAGDDFSQLYCFSFDVPGVFSSVNSTSCSRTVIGTGSNTQAASGLAWDDSTGTMYLSTTDIATSQLFTVNLANGATTFVGSMGGDSPGNIAIAVDSSGAFGPVGQMYGFDVVNDSLQSIDKTSGLADTIGPLGFDANFAQGMDFDESDGTCYIFAFNNFTFTGQLRTCNVSTGLTTLIGDIGAGFEEWTGPGILTGGGGGCQLEASTRRWASAGQDLRVDMSILHNRGRTVNVPFAISIQDAAGIQVVSHTTKTYKLEYGQKVNTTELVPLPKGLPAGIYTVIVSMKGMRDGREVATTRVEIR